MSTPSCPPSTTVAWDSVDAGTPADQPKHLRSRDAYWEALRFFRSRILRLLVQSSEEYGELVRRIEAISPRSEEKQHPVFLVKLTDGTTIVVARTYQEWIVSIDAPYAVRADFMGLFSPEYHILPEQYPQIPKELIFGPYSNNDGQFTVYFSTEELRIFTFFWIFSRKVMNINHIDEGKFTVN